MLKGLNDFLDKHEGRPVGSSTKAIKAERKRQGYDKHAKHEALESKKKEAGEHKFKTKGVTQKSLEHEDREIREEK
jgi:hypothetical protein